MSDPTTAPAAAPATPTAAAQPTAPVRDPENGRFTRDGRGQPAAKAAPAAAQPEAPRRYKLPGTEEELDEHELLAAAAEKRLEGNALQAKLKRLAELEAQAEKWKDPRKALSHEDQRKLAIQVAQDWQREQEELSLPPEQQAILRRERALREREEKLQAEEQRRQQEAEQAQMEEFRAAAVENVKAAVQISGLPPTPATYKRLFGLMAVAAKNGVAFPPEVLARKLRAAHDAEAQETFKALGGAQILRRNPALVEQLNSLEDAEALQLLAPLGERLRRLALEGRGLAPAAPQEAGGNVRQLVQPPKPGQRVDPHEAQRRIEARAKMR